MGASQREYKKVHKTIRTMPATMSSSTSSVPILKTVYDELDQLFSYRADHEENVLDQDSFFIGIKGLPIDLDQFATRPPLSPHHPQGDLATTEEFASLASAQFDVNGNRTTDNIDRTYGLIINNANIGGREAPREEPDPEQHRKDKQKMERAQSILFVTKTMVDPFSGEEVTIRSDSPKYAAYRDARKRQADAVMVRRGEALMRRRLATQPGALQPVVPIVHPVQPIPIHRLPIDARLIRDQPIVLDHRVDIRRAAMDPDVRLRKSVTARLLPAAPAAARLHGSAAPYKTRSLTAASATAPLTSGADSNGAELSDEDSVEQALKDLEESGGGLVADVIANARRVYRTTRIPSQLQGPGTYFHASYATPSNFYDDDVSKVPVEVTVVEKTKLLDVEAENVKISFKVSTVLINRPWMDTMLFKLHGWSLGGQPRACISDGVSTSTDKWLPYITTSLVLASDIEIESKWTDQDMRKINHSLNLKPHSRFGPFMLSTRNAAYHHHLYEPRLMRRPVVSSSLPRLNLPEDLQPIHTIRYPYRVIDVTSSRRRKRTIRMPGAQVVGVIASKIPASPKLSGIPYADNGLRLRSYI